MDEEQRKLVDDLMWKGEMAMRDRGLGDAEIAAKKRQLQEILEERPLSEAQWQMLERVDAGEPPRDIMASFGKDSWVVRLAMHRTVVRLAPFVVFGFLGYYGGPARGSDNTLPRGIPGLLLGLGFAVVMLVLVEIGSRRRPR